MHHIYQVPHLLVFVGKPLLLMGQVVSSLRVGDSWKTDYDGACFYTCN